MFKNLKAALTAVKFALMRRGSSAQDADDAVQEAWLAMELQERDAPIAEADAFLMRTAINLSIDAHRARRARGEEVDVDKASLVDNGPSVEDTVLARERVARLRVCIGRLDARLGRIYYDVLIREMSHADVAKKYRISISTLEKQLAKATMQVMEWMEGW